MSHLAEVDQKTQSDVASSIIRNELDGPRRDRHQVNDWDGGTGVMVRQNKVIKTEESAPVLIPSMTTGIIKTTLLWSAHRTQARHTTTPSAMRN